MAVELYVILKGFSKAAMNLNVDDEKKRHLNGEVYLHKSRWHKQPSVGK